MNTNTTFSILYLTESAQEWCKTLDWVEGITVEHALKESGFFETFPEKTGENTVCGIFSKKVSFSATLSCGDRLEIYRPLKADPKVIRRERAEQGKQMKKRT